MFRANSIAMWLTNCVIIASQFGATNDGKESQTFFRCYRAMIQFGLNMYVYDLSRFLSCLVRLTSFGISFRFNSDYRSEFFKPLSSIHRPCVTLLKFLKKTEFHCLSMVLPIISGEIELWRNVTVRRHTKAPFTNASEDGTAGPYINNTLI